MPFLPCLCNASNSVINSTAHSSNIDSLSSSRAILQSMPMYCIKLTESISPCAEAERALAIAKPYTFAINKSKSFRLSGVRINAGSLSFLS